MIDEAIIVDKKGRVPAFSLNLPSWDETDRLRQVEVALWKFRSKMLGQRRTPKG